MLPPLLRRVMATGTIWHLRGPKIIPSPPAGVSAVEVGGITLHSFAVRSPSRCRPNALWSGIGPPGGITDRIPLRRGGSHLLFPHAPSDPRSLLYWCVSAILPPFGWSPGTGGEIKTKIKCVGEKWTEFSSNILFGVQRDRPKLFATKTEPRKKLKNPALRAESEYFVCLFNYGGTSCLKKIPRIYCDFFACVSCVLVTPDNFLSFCLQFFSALCAGVKKIP